MIGSRTEGEASTSPCKGEVGREAAGRGSAPRRFARTPPMTARARRLRKQPSEAEKKLWQMLRRHQFETLGFRRQHPIGVYVLDFYCPALRPAIEPDGGQHNEPGLTARDERRTQWLASKDINVVRFWNNDVLRNLEGVWTVLMQEVEARRERPATPSLTHPLSGGGDSSVPPDLVCEQVKRRLPSLSENG
jgi:very-short-patch-repair endonuclease